MTRVCRARDSLAVVRMPGKNLDARRYGGLRGGATMSSSSEPAHLTNHHRTTLRQLFQHPVSHNIEWRAVVSLLEAVGSVSEHHDGKVAVTVGTQTEFLDPPPDKDIDPQMVLDLRRLLAQGGYEG
jgi:hypothetical protein